MGTFKERDHGELDNFYCGRCKGLMVNEPFFGSTEVLQVRRCVHCGEMIDVLILQNRNLPGVPGSPKRWTGRDS